MLCPFEFSIELEEYPFNVLLPFQITDIILSPEVAFTGDTMADFMLDPCNADALRAKILITEVWIYSSCKVSLRQTQLFKGWTIIWFWYAKENILFLGNFALIKGKSAHFVFVTKENGFSSQNKL